MKTQKTAALGTVDGSVLHTASLRIAFTPSVEVDNEAGIIRNASVMTIGPALGHGFDIDAVTIQQVATLINESSNGVKVRFKHPTPRDDGLMPDDLGTDVGYLKNARIEGDSVRGDIHLAEYAKSLPGVGDVWTYLLAKAKSDPAGFGLSAVIGYEAVPQLDGSGNPVGLVARVFYVRAVDFVGTPAANPNGLLSTPGNVPELPKISPAANAATTQGVSLMEPKLKDLLISSYELDGGASDEAAQSFYDGLTDEQKAEIESKLNPAPVAAAQAKTPAPAPLSRADDGDRLVALEAKRIAQLTQLGAMLKVPEDVVRQQIAANADVPTARQAMLEYIHKTAKPVESVRVGEDRNRASLAAALPEAIMLRANVSVEKPHERSAQLRQMTLIDMGRHYLASLGVNDAWSLSRTRISELLLSNRILARHYPQAALAQSTSDFTSILADTINKTLRQAYVDAPRNWTLWARRSTAADYKTITRAVLSESPDLVSRDEGKGITYVTLSDGKETFALSEYVGGIKLTRRAIINDDLDAFGRIPMLQGNAAARKEDDVAYGVITANAAMADSIALFHASHSNLIVSGGAAPSVTTLAATEALLMKQKGPKSAARLSLEPKFLLVPVALKTVAMQLINSTVDPAKNNQTINPYANKLTVVPNVRLDDNSSTAWYLLADYRDGQIDTVEVCFFVDEPEPVAKQETEFDTEDVKYAIRHSVVAKAIDFRGMAKNPGA